MARIALDIEDDRLKMTVRALAESAGHTCLADEVEVIITDNLSIAAAQAKELPVLYLCPVAEVRRAVEAMRQGVYGYILLPLIPMEVPLMIQRAIAPRASMEPKFRSVTLRDAEDAHIRKMLHHCRGNHTEAARLLGVGRNTLWRRLRNNGSKRLDKA